MENPPLVSIALCTYNGAAFLKEQLDSILKQQFENWEIVAVDDCSIDDTWKILNEYASQDLRFRLYRNDQNLGYNKNFERALQLCRGKYIAICDQDDIWHTDKLQIQLEAIQENELIYHDSEFIDHAGNSMQTKISDKFNFYRGNRAEAFLYLNCVSGHSIFMRQSVLRKALPFPRDFHYDQWLALVATKNGSIDFVDQCLVQYRQHQKNNTDMLALHATARSTNQKIAEIERESNWLKLCSEKFGHEPQRLTLKLYQQSLARNASFVYVPYAITIWRNRKILLALLKKSEVSKFFFTIRKIWGPKAKRVLG
ncbi:glycosyltransferase family 2 protein [Dyadobacter sediminis]|uniref:Glycosyltransferase family 2 protein n=1 Tax=Dyadobacter sediminis TaxID=1493691 RepID=A0A5R9KIZ5_9BACT|nr:glycosyltransferase family 2 protein [Dyadobacter sediminis]TLU96187.1 glycosyltransferase family 2 protein [Dyadobacter sediminis]GGB80016.1 hypothetical protein GCM10011325_04440 [Dyadobacter sediminis]